MAAAHKPGKVRLLLDYGFNLLNLNSVMLGTFAFNQRAIRCYERVGFKVIGRRRQARIIAGEAAQRLAQLDRQLG